MQVETMFLLMTIMSLRNCDDVSPDETNPLFCDDTSILSEPDCFKPELIKTERDFENTADARGDHVLINDGDDLPEL